MPVNIRGKEYFTVAERVGDFRRERESWTIETQLIHHDEQHVIMKALIMDGERLIATGYAEEERGSSNINKTSALENCETSAIGRALAAAGFAGTEYASADEVAGAISQQNEKELYERFAATTAANERNHDSLVAIREFLAEDNFDAAREAWNEVDHDDQRAIWVATTKGGWFTTRERNQMKYWSNEFEVSRKSA